MNRGGYVDLAALDAVAYARWRGSVDSAIAGESGQALLRELLTALDTMPEKRLAGGALVTTHGECCTLGVLGAHRGIEMQALDPDDYGQVAAALGVSPKVVQEIIFQNDEQDYSQAYEPRIPVEVGPPVPYHLWLVRIALDEGATRWKAMRDWVCRQLRQPVEHCCTAPALPR